MFKILSSKPNFTQRIKLLFLIIGIVTITLTSSTTNVSAGSNSGHSLSCIDAYNYVNSSRTWWYASMTNNPTSSIQCYHVKVSIWQYAISIDCIPSGNRVAYNESFNGFAATAYSGNLIVSGDAFKPCTAHESWTYPNGSYDYINLPFKDESGNLIP